MTTLRPACPRDNDTMARTHHSGAMVSGGNPHDGIRIGELAQRTGASSTRSLRYYEQRGLLTSHRDQMATVATATTSSISSPTCADCLSAGLSVADIQQFGSCLTSPDLGSSPCAPASKSTSSDSALSMTRSPRSPTYVTTLPRTPTAYARISSPDQEDRGAQAGEGDVI